MNIDWLKPTVEDLAKEGIKKIIARWWKNIFHKPTILAFTGMQGVGKTVLLDYLTGKAYARGYTSPLQSQEQEKGAITLGDQRLVVHVVPGQAASEPRLRALREIFTGDQAVDGVVHVVAFGHAVIRNEDARQALIKDGKITTISKFNQHQLIREIEDLKETCNAIRQAHHKHRCPTWMIVAVDKIDLYFSSIARARAYYFPSANNDFVSLLEELTDRVGTDFFRWDSVPVCGSLTPLLWNKTTLNPQIDAEQRDAYIAQLLRLLGSYIRPA